MFRHSIMLILSVATCQTLVAQKGYELDFAWYVGGKDYEQVRDITTDDSGNIYITGGTSSPDFITTPGAYANKLNVQGSKIMDAFVMKFNPEGKLIWATLFGGPEYDRAYAIEVDNTGCVYIAGRAGKGLPTTKSAFQKSFAGDNDPNKLYGEQDGFIAKFSPDGSALLWCSYFGAPDRGFIRDIALDRSNDVFIIATEASDNYKDVGKDAIQGQRHGGYDGVIAKIATDGSKVLWATYLGGSGDDFMGPSIAVNANQDIVVCGTASSPDMMTTKLAFDKSFNGMEDVFIAILSNDGSKLLLGTYIGGSGVDGTETHNLCIDKHDNIIVAATTSSEDFPVTPNAYQVRYGGSGVAGTGLRTNYPFDGFVAKLSPDGSRLIAATYLGGNAGEGLEGVDTDNDGNIYCGGSSYSKAIALSDGKEKRSSGRNAGQIVAGFDKDLSQLIYFSFFGGENIDYGRTLCVDAQGDILFAGETNSSDYPAENTYCGGKQDGTVAKLRREARKRFSR